MGQTEQTSIQAGQPAGEPGHAVEPRDPGQVGTGPSPSGAGEAANRSQTPGGRRIFQQLDTSADFPYSFSEYARKALWMAVHALLIRFGPPRSPGWYRFWLGLFGAKLAPTCKLRPSVKVRHPWLLEIGEHSVLGDDVEVYNLGPIRIGEHTVISQNTHLCNGSHDYRDPSLPLVRPKMEIGSGVWICADAFIGPGVSIGDNTLIGARSVVMRDVPPGVIAAGNLAQVVRDRPMPGIEGQEPAR